MKLNTIRNYEKLHYTIVKIANIDHKSRIISLSIKAIEIDDEKAAIRDHKKQESSEVSPGTIGDLIKAELDKS